MNIARNSSVYFVNDIEWWWGGKKSRLPKGFERSLYVFNRTKMKDSLSKLFQEEKKGCSPEIDVLNNYFIWYNESRIKKVVYFFFH